MPSYDDLRKTHDEVAEKLAEKQRAELLHKPSNAASLKVEAARQATPEAAQQPTDYLPQNPVRNMTTEQVVGFNRATGAWSKEQGQQYLNAQAERSHNSQLVMNKEHTRHAREFVQEQRAQEMSPPEVAKLYEQHGKKREAAAFERQQQIYANDRDEEGGKQHCVEQARAALKVQASAELRKARQAERLEAQVNAYQATQARPQTSPEAGKAQEKSVKTQEQPRVVMATLDGGLVAQQREAMQGARKPAIAPQPGKSPEPQTAVKIAGNTADPDKARQDAERVARIVAQKQNPNSSAKDPDQAREEAERVARIVAQKQNPNSPAKDPDQAREEAERVARIVARKRGEPVSQEKQDMPPPTPKPRIRR